MKHFRELRVYRQAFAAAQRIYELSRDWPPGERHALTDQIRRASRSVCRNVAEAWRKRRYEKHFVSKLSDADGEAAETQSWLDFAQACNYLSREDYEVLDRAYELIIGGLVKMMANPEAWCGPSNLIREEEADYLAPPSPLPDSHTPTPPSSSPA